MAGDSWGTGALGALEARGSLEAHRELGTRGLLEHWGTGTFGALLTLWAIVRLLVVSEINFWLLSLRGSQFGQVAALYAKLSLH